MKKISFLSIIILILFTGCKKADYNPFILEFTDGESVSISSNAQQITLKYIAQNAENLEVKESPSWCSAGKPGESSITVMVGANNTGSSREGIFTIGADDGSTSITIIQTGNNSSIIIENNTYAFTKEGGEADVIIQHSFAEVAVEVASDAQSWLTVTDPITYASSSFRLSVAANTSQTLRNGKITVKDKSGTATETISIVQAGNNNTSEQNLSITPNSDYDLTLEATIANNLSSGERLQSYGFCWSSSNPFPDNSYRNISQAPDRAASGYTLTYTLGNIADGKTYYIRSFIVTNKGTYYSAPKTYQAPSLTYDNNTVKAPVIFHVLYNDASDKNQNIREEVLDDAIRYANMIFRNKLSPSTGTDINLEFYRAETDPDGIPLTEKGIDRVAYNYNINISCNQFMATDSPYFNPQLIWDPSKYVNIWIFNFKEEGVTGLTPIAALPSQYAQNGYNIADYYIANGLNMMYGIALDSKGLQSGSLSTLAHEIGHLYGLHHVFGEKSTGNSSAYTCDADDYCNDTPNYDRNVYMANIETFGYMWQPCTGGALFRSSNIMDYYFSDLNSLTNDQRTRIQYVLEHGIYAPPGNATLYSVYSLPYADEPPHIMLR